MENLNTHLAPGFTLNNLVPAPVNVVVLRGLLALLPAEFCGSGCADCYVNPQISSLGVQDGLVLIWLYFMDMRCWCSAILASLRIDISILRLKENSNLAVSNMEALCKLNSIKNLSSKLY